MRRSMLVTGFQSLSAAALATLTLSAFEPAQAQSLGIDREGFSTREILTPDSSVNAEPLPTTGVPGEYPYDRYMRLGYAAAQRSEPQTAILYFRNALTIRPGDRLATIAYWNMYDQLVESGAIAQTPATPQETRSEPQSAYDYYMGLGYDATEAGDYQAALDYFQQALDQRPNDTYASQAIRNVTTYIQRGQQ